MPCAGRRMLELKKVGFATAELANEARPPKIDAGHAFTCLHRQGAAPNDQHHLRPFLKAAIVDDKPLVINGHGHLQSVAVRCHFDSRLMVLGDFALVPCMASCQMAIAIHGCSVVKQWLLMD